MKPQLDLIYIITSSATRAEAIKRTIDLRGIDEIRAVAFDVALPQIEKQKPILVILDAQDGNLPRTLQLVQQLANDIKRIILAETFEEEAFLTAYDHGVRDYLTMPMADAHLVSTVIRLLQERRMQQLIVQKDQILVELGVVSNHTLTFTTAHVFKVLERCFKQAQQHKTDSLSLLLIEVKGLEALHSESHKIDILKTIANAIKDCARDTDLVGELLVNKFAVILPHTGIRGVRTAAKRLMGRLQDLHFKPEEDPLNIQIAMGLAEASGCQHYEALLEKALEDLRHPTSANSHHIHMV